MNPDGGSYNPNTFVTITAIPDSGYVFNGWSGDLDGDQNPSLIILNKDKSVTALFKQIISSIHANGTLAGQTKLGQNFPNPFSTETTIPFELNEASHIKISVLNMLMQEVCTLTDKHLLPGKYSTTWNGTDRSGNRIHTGIYFCKMESEFQLVQVKKIILQTLF